MTWLKQRREQLELSQEAFAIKLQQAGLDVSRALISHWETGRGNVPIRDVEARRALARALDLTVSELLNLAGEVEIEDEIVSSIPSETARRAALIISRLPPDAQRTALEQLRALERLVVGGQNAGV